MSLPSYSSRSANLASASAPKERPRSRNATSKYPGTSNKLIMMPQSQAVTTKAPNLGFTATTIPAMISIIPTTIMKVAGSIPVHLGTKGVRYWVQSTSKLKNLSSPATIGATVNPNLRIV